MHNFLVSICPFSLWVLTIIQLAFIIYFAYFFAKNKKYECLLSALISFGLFYDSLMLSLGVFLKEGTVFKAFSQFRFISHGALIPLLFALTALVLNVKKPIKYSLFVLTGILSILGICEGIATVLEPSVVADITRYMSSKELTPAWASSISSLLSYGAVAPLMIGGIIDIIKKNGPYYFLSGFLMFAFSALGPATGNFDLIFFISMFGEFFMMLFILLTLKKHA